MLAVLFQSIMENIIIVSTESKISEIVTQSINMEFRRLINQDAVLWLKSIKKMPKKNRGIIGSDGKLSFFCYFNGEKWLQFDRLIGEIEIEQPVFWCEVPVYSNR